MLCGVKARPLNDLHHPRVVHIKLLPRVFDIWGSLRVAPNNTRTISNDSCLWMYERSRPQTPHLEVGFSIDYFSLVPSPS